MCKKHVIVVTQGCKINAEQCFKASQVLKKLFLFLNTLVSDVDFTGTI